MIKRLLILLIRKPRLLDYFTLLILWPFSHYLISLREWDTLAERLQNPYYWVALLFTYGCGVGVMWYIRWQNTRLNDHYGMEDDWSQRVTRQLIGNIAVPLFLVLLLVSGYFLAFGKNIFTRNYFQNEFPVVAMSISILSLLYLGQDLLVYFDDRERERRVFEDFSAAWASPGPVRVVPLVREATLPVQDSHGNREQIPAVRVGLLQRHNRKTYAYTLDGKIYTVLLPKAELGQWAVDNEACQASQWFFVMPQAIAGAPVTTGKGWNFPLVTGTRIGKERGIDTTRADDGATLYWVCVSKHRAAEARRWYSHLAARGFFGPTN